MQIISNRLVRFEKTKNGEGYSHVEDHIVVQASPNPQIVPDWVKTTDHYKLLLKDKSVVEVVYGSKETVNAVPANTVTQPTEVPAVKIAQVVK